MRNAHRLITGASTGIGEPPRCAWRARAGPFSQAFAIPPSARRCSPGRPGGEADGGSAGARHHRPRQVAAAAAEFVRSATGAAGLDALVNNAGVALGGPLELVPMEELRDQFEVNFFGQIAMTQALIPALRRAGGRVLLVSSDRRARHHALYGPLLRLEVRTGGGRRLAARGAGRSRIQVALIEPGSMATPMWDKGSEELDRTASNVPPSCSSSTATCPPRWRRRCRAPPSAASRPSASRRRSRARWPPGACARAISSASTRTAMAWLKRLLPDHVLDRVLRRASGFEADWSIGDRAALGALATVAPHLP